MIRNENKFCVIAKQMIQLLIGYRRSQGDEPPVLKCSLHEFPFSPPICDVKLLGSSVYIKTNVIEEF